MRAIIEAREAVEAEESRTGNVAAAVKLGLQMKKEDDARKQARKEAAYNRELLQHTNERMRLTPTLGAAWMREQAAAAAEDHGEPSCYQAMSKEFREGFEDAGQHIASAIRAITLPTDANLLAEAMKLPEVAALTHAVASQIAFMDMCENHGELRNRLDAALAPFTSAKETP